jgi:hypothetical protein
MPSPLAGGSGLPGASLRGIGVAPIAQRTRNSNVYLGIGDHAQHRLDRVFATGRRSLLNELDRALVSGPLGWPLSCLREVI